MIFILLFSPTSKKGNKEQNQKGTERKRAYGAFFTVINDYNNFSRVLRLKKYYNLTPEQIKNNLLYPFSSISEKTLDRMCRAESSGEVFSVMQETHTGKMIEQIGYVYASDISPRVKIQTCKKEYVFLKQSFCCDDFIYVRCRNRAYEYYNLD